MTPRTPLLDQLSPSDRQVLAAWVAEFRQTWTDTRLGSSLADLPPIGSPLRRAALVEMVKIDIAQHWQKGNRVRLEQYLRGLPELGTAETVPLELIQAEYEVRQRAGDTVTPSQMMLRF